MVAPEEQRLVDLAQPAQRQLMSKTMSEAG
jgi:hypothetical protein